MDDTHLKFKNSPLKMTRNPNGKQVVFIVFGQPSFFRGYVKLRECTHFDVRNKIDSICMYLYYEMCETSLNYLMQGSFNGTHFGGNQTIQMYGKLEGLPL